MDAVISLEEARRRDGILRAYIEGRDWELDREGELVRALVMNSVELLPRYPLLVGLEWDAAGEGRGDLLFFDGGQRLAVVEVKHLKPGKRNRNRNLVEKQAKRFAARARQMHPQATIEALVYTDDEYDTAQGPRAPIARQRWGEE